MRTSDILLAGFLAAQHVAVKKVRGEDGDIFEINLEESDPIVVQFSSSDGYNTNINRLVRAMESLSEMEVDHTFATDTIQES